VFTDALAALRRLPTWVPVVALLFLGVVSMGRQWTGPVLWELDALFYQAHVEQLRGQDRDEAIHSVFSGPLSQRAREIEAATEDKRRVRDPAWPVYSERFYERRWLLPTLAAGMYPVFGERSLKELSLLAYIAIGPLLFLLLRRRFHPLTAFVMAAAVLALPPLRDWTVFPLTDSAGLALLAAGLLAALAVYERGLKWLPAWIACIFALALTRDTAFVLVLAAGALALMQRDRRSVWLVASGFAASLPAPLIWSVGIREQLAYVFADHVKPQDTSWSFVTSEYFPHLRDVASKYVDYATGHPHVVLFFLVGVVCAFVLAPRRDPFFALLQGTFAGYLVLLAIGPTFSIFRYELVLVPLAAAGVALAGERLAHVLARALETRRTRRLAPATEGASGG
jgi:hypothetical protein